MVALVATVSRCFQMLWCTLSLTYASPSVTPVKTVFYSLPSPLCRILRTMIDVPTDTIILSMVVPDRCKGLKADSGAVQYLLHYVTRREGEESSYCMNKPAP